MSENRDINEIGLKFYETRTERSFKDLYDRITPGLYIYIKKILRDPDLTGFILSRTMEMVHEKIGLFNPNYKISTWIYRIAYTNSCFTLRAQNKNKTYYISEFVEEENKMLHRYEAANAINDYGDEKEESPMVEEILREISGLDDLSRQLIQKRFYENMQFKMIAESMGMEVKVVKERLRDIKRLIRKRIRDRIANPTPELEPSMEIDFLDTDFEAIRIPKPLGYAFERYEEISSEQQMEFERLEHVQAAD